jgi:putative membrane protein
MTSDDLKRDPRNYLAAERTFLAWIRTGLALMGFGFVVARFGLFLRELQSERGGPTVHVGLSLWFGTALIGVGIVVNIISAWQHVRGVEALNRGETAFDKPSPTGIAVALFLAVVGLGMMVYLVFGLK